VLTMKKYWKQLMSLLLAAVLLAGCGASAPAQTEAPETTAPVQTAQRTEEALAQIRTLGKSPDDNYRTWYEIFVYSFCDSNGDGIGDLQGVISKLDYIQNLGITGIWFMPVNPSQSYHKYDVADYYDIDPAYGTLADMEQLLAECESRGIKVILDLVLNHTANNHQWFLTAAEYLGTLPEGAEPDSAVCPYVDYYYFSRESNVCYYDVPGAPGWYYEGKFSPDMPDLNLANEALRADIQAIMEFWLGKGVHGFRLDAVKEFYSGNAPANVEVLSWIQQTAQSIKPDVYLVGEAWEGFGALQQYYESGLTSFFAFPFGTADGKIAKVLRAAGRESEVKSYAAALQQADTAYMAIHPGYIDAPFLSNHDVGRIAGFVNRDVNKIKLAGAMNLFMSGSTFIYYGEELGMIGAGNDPSKRAPMYWNAARDNGTTNPPPECQLPEEYPCGSLEEQKNDDLSVWNYYRQAIAIRNAIPAIARGRTTAEEALNTGCVSAFRKTTEQGSCIILMNINTEPAQVHLNSYQLWQLAATLTVGDEEVTVQEQILNLPAYGVAVLTEA